MTKVDAYIDAVRARRAIEAAIKDEGETSERMRALREARNAVATAYGKLSGREAWQARQRLETPKSVNAVDAGDNQ